ncbi:MAG: hypothetical protein CVT78_07425 [Alphaproteobacteria bacterium HGW-Alphaproteobacteria-17]|nr:MAG: hypothetical protein CVT78_07425 [Alphaproteobacteria bacterium HGW-Alphaproteobacteria-17]
MRSQTLGLSAALTLLALPTAANAKEEPLQLAPSSPWNIDYADDYCRLARTFGTDSQKVTLLIDRFAPGARFRLTLVGPVMKRTTPDGTATVRFGKVLPSQKLYFHTGDFNKDTPAWVFSSSVRLRPSPPQVDPNSPDAPPSFEADEAGVTEIAIGAPLRRHIVLQTGSMQKSFAALRSCTDNLVASWGVDIERYRNAVWSVPLSSPATWVTNADYPPGMARTFQPGLVEFRLSIDPTGKVTECRIQQSTNPDGFNAAVCKAMMRRARFQPARDKNGEPIASYYQNSVRFMIGQS